MDILLVFRRLLREFGLCKGLRYELILEYRWFFCWFLLRFVEPVFNAEVINELWYGWEFLLVKLREWREARELWRNLRLREEVWLTWGRSISKFATIIRFQFVRGSASLGKSFYRHVQKLNLLFPIFSGIRFREADLGCSCRLTWLRWLLH